MEGTAEIFFPEGNQVFYNEVQVFNRELSITMISEYAKQQQAKEAEAYQAKLAGSPPDAEVPLPPSKKGLRILEALSATGLRSVRYYNEISPQIEHVVANDLKPEAVEAIRANVVRNGLDPDAQVIPSCGDANVVMREAAARREFYDVIDLDPYGSAAPFLDASMAAIADGGLLAVTCTDMAVLAGAKPEACFSKYASMPLSRKFCHEGGLRILLASLERVASSHKKYIAPVLSCSIDFYCRVFVTVHNSAIEARHASAKLAHVFACNQCQAFALQPLGRSKLSSSGKSIRTSAPKGPVVGQACTECGGAFSLGGPYYANEIHNRGFLTSTLASLEEDAEASAAKFATLPRILGRLSVSLEELEGAPLYYDLSALMKFFSSSTPQRDMFYGGVASLGYDISPTHASVTGFKTNAPITAVHAVAAAWLAKQGKEVAPGTPAANVLASLPPELVASVSLDKSLAPKFDSATKNMARFPVNPTAYWGPKSRASGTKRSSTSGPVDLPAKRRKQQEKMAAKRNRKRLCQFIMRTGECSVPDCPRIHPTPDQIALIQSSTMSKGEKKAFISKLVNDSQ